VRYDHTGKVTLEQIYTQSDPRDYFTTLHALDYRIPGLAAPYFARLIEDYRAARGVPVPRVLDLGSSYGIDAALLPCGLTLAELYARYTTADGISRDELLARDRASVRDRDTGRARFVGLDSSQPALAYAQEAGFLDETIWADLEVAEPTEQQRTQLAGVDLVLSTGCVGYVGARTLLRIAEACGGKRPWMAHAVLRMFTFEPIAECLAALGYDTARVSGLFRQRRFASRQEQAQVLETLADAGVDAAGLEADGWLYAHLYVSRPRGRESPAARDDRRTKARTR
jgi:SAM-dependent methyltransferase